MFQCNATIFKWCPQEVLTQFVSSYACKVVSLAYTLQPLINNCQVNPLYTTSRFPNKPQTIALFRFVCVFILCILRFIGFLLFLYLTLCLVSPFCASYALLVFSCFLHLTLCLFLDFVHVSAFGLFVYFSVLNQYCWNILKRGFLGNQVWQFWIASWRWCELCMLSVQKLLICFIKPWECW